MYLDVTHSTIISTIVLLLLPVLEVLVLLAQQMTSDSFNEELYNNSSTDYSARCVPDLVNFGFRTWMNNSGDTISLHTQEP